MNKVPSWIQLPKYAQFPSEKFLERTLKIKTIKEIEKMRDPCKITRDCLQYISELVKPGVSTGYLNDQAHQFMIQRNAYPSPLAYCGFPKSICTSVNDVVCHGIPSYQSILKDGDLVSVDVTCFYYGYHGDACRTFAVGQRCSAEAQQLLQHSKQCTLQAIQQVVRNGALIKDIGGSIERFCALHGLSSVKEFTGHGIGQDFHELPYIRHYAYEREDRGEPVRMQTGMVFTVEPMLCTGSNEISIAEEDGWTVQTVDGQWCAQHEDTVLVTDNGFEILTAEL